jgi:ubiquinone/menaquinone biosynthesis C-methylase UbiE
MDLASTDDRVIAAEGFSATQADQDEYYVNDRSEILQFLPADAQTLIDVGCGQGLFSAAVKKQFPSCEVWGLEPFSQPAQSARGRCDKLIVQSFDEANLPEGYFDVVTMLDVLEHMSWPEPALAKVRRILKPGGKVVLSLPNVQYFLNLIELIVRNDWEYKDSGILDRTHLRFYTTKSAARMLEANGFEVEIVAGINPHRPRWFYRPLLAMFPRVTHWMLFFQFVLVARPIQTKAGS